MDRRLGLFIGAGVLAGAFSGLLAYGTAHIHGFAGDNTFRYLFLIEGIPSFALAVTVYFCLPSRPDRSKYLTEDERTLVITRLNRDSLGEGHTGIDWSGVRRALTDWRMWVTSIMYSAMNLTLGR